MTPGKDMESDDARRRADLTTQEYADVSAYMRMEAAQLEAQPRVLKEGNSFAIFNAHGDILSMQSGETGLFHQDTRHLSHYEMLISSARPLLLSSNVGRDDTILSVDATNPDFGLPGQSQLGRDQIHLLRSLFLLDGVCYERVKLRNYDAKPVDLLLQVLFDADFADIFEVRGQRRRQKGTRLRTEIDGDSAVLAYRGLDGIIRSTRLTFEPMPSHLSPTSAAFRISLAPGETTTCFVTTSCTADVAKKQNFSFYRRQARRARRARRSMSAHIYSSNELFNEWTNQSAADLYMLISDTEQGPYPFAGTPWFSCPFGRDGIITALQYLWLDPSIARGVLAFLAATQATEVNPDQDAEPGKILHETRRGEMAMLGEVPFRLYYGSVDSTPLFVMLAGAYFERTGDRDFIAGVWPQIEAALRWIDDYGDLDGDGFVEYAKRTPNGLANQGWKDSFDSVFHADGRLAKAPIAICEVQAYVFAAKRAAATLAAALGKTVQSQTWKMQADRLRDRFESVFWCDELGSYALALDADKQSCRVRASNAGHALFCGIASEERAARVAATLTTPDFLSSWGIRTVAASESRYNPMSYHNGSIWPHDNALIALGLARYGLKQEVLKILTGLFDAAIFMDSHRLPELFCGFNRRGAEGPVLYPVACAPQAWASTTVAGLLAACLGISFDIPAGQVRVDRPVLPPFLAQVQVLKTTVGDASVDFTFLRQPGEVAVNVSGRRGQVDVLVTH
ncbi:glycogen debranching N-terminal domain-containing protein [Virgifigura deserti]|uniref:amylo-alpha-1,6-glucosidase n=1 Tax=Virgifigura deserti TaxID=2268457 RepID=UPI003CCBDE64